MTPRRRTHAALAAFTLLGFALRAHHLGYQSLWSDEDITLDRAVAPLHHLLSTLPVEHAPLYFVVIRLWGLLAGTTDVALRYPSLCAGVVTVPLVGIIAGRLTRGRATLPAALLAAVNPFAVWYGQEARMYALLGALGAAALAAALLARESEGRSLHRWVAVGILAALTVYTHYYGALVLAVLGAWGCVDLVTGGNGRRRGWIVAGSVAAVLFAPWLPRAVGVLDFPGWREPISAAQVPAIDLATWAGGPTAPAAAAYWARAAYALAAAAGVAAWALTMLWPGRPAARRRLGLLGLLLVAAPLAAAAGIAVLQESCRLGDALRGLGCRVDLHPRYFSGVMPALFVSAGAGIAAVPGRAAPWAAAAIVAAAAVVPLTHLYADPAYQKQDYGAFVHVVERAAGYEDTVLFLDGPSYGLTRRYEIDDSPVKIVNLQSSGNAERSPDERAARIAELADEYPHLWLATNGESWDLGHGWLEKNAYPISHAAFQTITLWRYYSPRPDPVTTGATATSCQDDAAGCLGIATTSLASGTPLAVALTWQGQGQLPSDAKVSLRLLDAGQNVITSADRPIAAAGAGREDGAADVVSRQGLMLPDALPAPGSLELTVVLYRAGDLTPLGTWRFPITG